MEYRNTMLSLIKVKNWIVFSIGILFLSYALFTSLILGYMLPDLWIWGFICFCTCVYSFSSYVYNNKLKKKKHVILKILGIIINSLALILILTFLIFEGILIAHMSTKPAQSLDYIIVLGAHVKQGKPGQALMSRLDTAVNYLNENPDTIVIVTGGQGKNEIISEGDCSAEYLKSKGILENRILIENTSTSTYENFLNVSKLISASDNDNIGFITNSFHIFRAELNAQSVGFSDISGISADENIPEITIPHYMIREFCACASEFLHGRYF